MPPEAPESVQRDAESALTYVIVICSFMLFGMAMKLGYELFKIILTKKD